MTAYNVIDRAKLVVGQPDDISYVLANLDEIARILNGELTNDNVKATAAIAIAKLADPGATKVIGSGGGAAAAVVPPGTMIAEHLSNAIIGPTTISPTGTGGDALFNFPAGTYEATKYYLDIWFASASVNAGVHPLYFLLTRADGITVLASWQSITLDTTNRGPFLVRTEFTPPAVTEVFGVRWGSDGGGATHTLSNGGGGVRVIQAKITKA